MKPHHKLIEAAGLTTTVLVVDEDRRESAALCVILSEAGYNSIPLNNAAEALKLAEQSTVEVCLADDRPGAAMSLEFLRSMRRQSPTTAVIMLSESAHIENVVMAMRSGARAYLDKPVASAKLLEVVTRCIRRQSTSPISVSAASRESFRLAGRVASTDVSVLISGDSGTGKEIIARHIHDNSERADGPFIAFNCAAIPEQMIEAMLFGHEKGAFTGAHKSKPGKFEIANGGTLLLDEISEMAISMQAKLLRVLQEREVERVGGRTPLPIDVRVLATSNRNLKSLVAEGEFREDLFYRLSVFPLLLHPLRDRLEDILPLAEFFLEKHSSKLDVFPKLDEDAQRLLLGHAWPGNVRELENAIQRALVMYQGEVITAEDLGLQGSTTSLPGNATLYRQMRETEQVLIRRALESCSGRRRDAAKALGISDRTLRHKLQRIREQDGIIL